ncbi:FAS1-like dehydratase domain-containing protein [Nocardia alni]|uniref:FAS1-like dehydratase domain-containing protein n=1 Tax=Nocardia alni TaxID=2815723 RepID=UPI001C23D7AB|nr:MaoC family dehydratase N-terminal domain-containing protein [Nocardia alni]
MRTDERGPVIDARARELIGTVTFTWTSEPVSLRQVREYVAATGGRPEQWGDPGDPHAPVPTPPLFFHAACRPVVALADLLEDGQYPFLGVPGVRGRSMAGGQSYEILAPVRVGDVLTVRERLSSLSEKQGRSGPLVITETESEYTNGDDVLVARFRQTVIFR